MCLAAFAAGACDAFPLVVAANRDESHRRLTAAADWWTEPSGILGGRDLEAGGGWLAVDRRGRLAAVTNRPSPKGRGFSGSRGHLVSDYLAAADSAETFCEERARAPAEYGPYNLLLFDGDWLFHASNRTGVQWLAPGIHVLSNAPLGTSWPKTQFAAARLAAILEDEPGRDDLVRRLFELLESRATQNAGADGKELHWRARTVFVTDPRYGTRSSTVVLMSRDGELMFAERRFGADGRRRGESTFRFRANRAVSGRVNRP
ncbi:MAG: NRDE family protein [Proteobacteria bacterium]|nr:NRDE family protein [Pseudomonadota bacterium]